MFVEVILIVHWYIWLTIDTIHLILRVLLILLLYIDQVFTISSSTVISSWKWKESVSLSFAFHSYKFLLPIGSTKVLIPITDSHGGMTFCSWRHSIRNYSNKYNKRTKTKFIRNYLLYTYGITNRETLVHVFNLILWKL